MITVEIPGYRQLALHHVVLDYNGTLAVDGIPVAGIKNKLMKLAENLEVHVLTADTFGEARKGLDAVPCRLSILAVDSQDVGKLDYVKKLGAEQCVCVGNGRNDRLMLRESALGIAVILEEGIAVETLSAADIVCSNIHAALDLLTNPLRLTATLRS